MGTVGRLSLSYCLLLLAPPTGAFVVHTPVPRPAAVPMRGVRAGGGRGGGTRQVFIPAVATRAQALAGERGSSISGVLVGTGRSTSGGRTSVVASASSSSNSDSSSHWADRDQWFNASKEERRACLVRARGRELDPLEEAAFGWCESMKMCVEGSPLEGVLKGVGYDTFKQVCETPPAPANDALSMGQLLQFDPSLPLPADLLPDLTDRVTVQQLNVGINGSEFRMNASIAGTLETFFKVRTYPVAVTSTATVWYQGMEVAEITFKGGLDSWWPQKEEKPKQQQQQQQGWGGLGDNATSDDAMKAIMTGALTVGVDMVNQLLPNYGIFNGTVRATEMVPLDEVGFEKFVRDVITMPKVENLTLVSSNDLLLRTPPNLPGLDLPAPRGLDLKLMNLKATKPLNLKGFDSFRKPWGGGEDVFLFMDDKDVQTTREGLTLGCVLEINNPSDMTVDLTDFRFRVLHNRVDVGFLVVEEGHLEGPGTHEVRARIVLMHALTKGGAFDEFLGVVLGGGVISRVVGESEEDKIRHTIALRPDPYQVKGDADSSVGAIVVKVIRNVELDGRLLLTDRRLVDRVDISQPFNAFGSAGTVIFKNPLPVPLTIGALRGAVLKDEATGKELGKVQFTQIKEASAYASQRTSVDESELVADGHLTIPPFGQVETKVVVKAGMRLMSPSLYSEKLRVTVSMESLDVLVGDPSAAEIGIFRHSLAFTCSHVPIGFKLE